MKTVRGIAVLLLFINFFTPFMFPIFLVKLGVAFGVVWSMSCLIGMLCINAHENELAEKRNKDKYHF